MISSEAAHLIYKCTDFYAPEDEHAIAWNDAELQIDWRLPAGVQPILSARDTTAKRFRDAPYYS